MPNLLNAPSVRERLGGISDMTLYRHLNNPDLSFPKPLYINTRRYWREADLASWIDSRMEAA